MRLENIRHQKVEFENKEPKSSANAKCTLTTAVVSQSSNAVVMLHATDSVCSEIATNRVGANLMSHLLLNCGDGKGSKL